MQYRCLTELGVIPLLWVSYTETSAWNGWDKDVTTAVKRLEKQTLQVRGFRVEAKNLQIGASPPGNFDSREGVLETLFWLS